MKSCKLPVKILIVMSVMLVMGVLLLVGVYMLPTGRMKAHIANSDDTFNYEGIYPQIMEGYKSSQLDNYTDALMYATAIHEGSGNAVRDAMVNARYEYRDENMVQALNDYANDVAVKDALKYEYYYPRYWHGYLVILKPLLFLFEVGEIRMLNMVLQGALLVALLYLIRKKLGERYQLPVLLMAAVLNPIVLPLSLQFSWVYYISLVGAVWLLCLKNPFEKKGYILLFLALGMLTSYMDLLTYPLITLGLPLVLLLPLDEGASWKKRLLRMTESSFIWAVGYAVMWMGKWLCALLLGGINIFEDVFSEILFRVSMTGEQEEAINIGMVLERNFGVLLKVPYLLMVLLFIIGVFILKKRDAGKGNSKRLLDALPWVLIMLMPVVWLVVLSNHSWVHYWFTYRELAVTALAAGVAVVELCLPNTTRCE